MPVLRSAPEIQVVIATKNSERYLSECLESVVQQDLPPVKVTVVDQASGDSTRNIASLFNLVEVQDQLGTGIPQAWNQGIQSANTEFVAMIDSDDYWAPTFLSDTFTALTSHPTAMYAVARAKFLVPATHIPRGFRAELVNAEKFGWMPGTTLVRRAVFGEIGGFPEDFRIASDIEWFGRLRTSKIPYVTSEGVGLYKRMHGDNFSLSTEFADIYRTEILRIARGRIRTESSSIAKERHLGEPH